MKGNIMRHTHQRSRRAVRCLVIGFAFCSIAKAVDFPEGEPNNSKAAATPALGMVDGDRLTGVTSGSSPSPGDASVDYFRVQNSVRPAGIYRHRLVITTDGTNGHAGHIRGLMQSSGVIDTTDAQVQTSNMSTSPPRFNQWYGFGKGEQFYYRISGLPGTTRGYFCTLSTTPVTPTVIAGTLSEGPITITTVLQGHASDTELWVYDANFNAIADYGNDDSLVGGTSEQSNLVRTFAPGVYYLAVSDFNLANNLPSPLDDNFRNGEVLDFPNILVARTVSPTPLNVSFTISDTAGHSHAVTASKTGPYEIAWFTFTVTDGGGGGCTCRGDLSGDSIISAADVSLFVAALMNETAEVCADVNLDTFEDGRDVRPFTAAVIAGACP